MKFKKPSKKSGMDTATLVGSAATGAMISKGVVGLLPNGNELTTSAIAAISTGLAAAMVSGNDTMSVAARGAFVGMSIEQSIEAIKLIAQKNVNTANISNATLKSFIEKSLGLSEGLNGVVKFAALEPKRDYSDIWKAPIARQPQAESFNIKS